MMILLPVQALGHTGQIEALLELLRDSWSGERGLPEPTTYACNAAIAACARVGRLNEALEVYADMVRVSNPPLDG